MAGKRKSPVTAVFMVSNVEKRRVEFLKEGVMPLLPPAPCDWTSVESQVDGVPWLPVGWQFLSSKSRLNFVRLAMNVLEKDGGVSTRL